MKYEVNLYEGWIPARVTHASARHKPNPADWNPQGAGLVESRSILFFNPSLVFLRFTTGNLVSEDPSQRWKTTAGHATVWIPKI